MAAAADGGVISMELGWDSDNPSSEEAVDSDQRYSSETHEAAQAERVLLEEQLEQNPNRRGNEDWRDANEKNLN